VPTLIRNAHSAGTIALDNEVRIEAENIIDELNITMKWVSYPGRTNGTAMAAEVDFAAPGGALRQRRLAFGTIAAGRLTQSETRRQAAPGWSRGPNTGRLSGRRMIGAAL
jgi:hypothetical protein